MELAHFYHRHRIHRLSEHPDFSYFELAIWLHTLARSLITIFVPILLIQTGYSISEVIIYFLIYNAVDIPLNFVADRLIRKIGARKAIILSTLAIIIFFGLLGVLVPTSWPLLILLALFAAIYDTLFWVAHFYIFIEANRDQNLNMGSRVGALDAVRRFAQIAGPVVGGLVLVILGKQFLVVVSIAIFALSIVPLYRMRHLRDIPEGKRIPMREFFENPLEKRNYTSMALWGVNSEVGNILWPLFLFSVFGTVGSVAAVPVIASLIAISFSFFVGKLTKRYATRMIAIGSFSIACIWILRSIFQGAPLYYATIFLAGFFVLLITVPLDSSIVGRGLQRDPLSSSTYRNAASMSSRVILYLILFLLLEVFKVSFGLAAVSLFVIFMLVTSSRFSGMINMWPNQK